MFSKKQIRTLIIPLMIEQVLTSLMGTADTMMVSNAGSAAISAVSLVDSINILVIYVFSAMATGGAIVCAQYLGRGDAREATESGKQLILSVLVLSVMIALLCVLLNRPLLRLIFGSVEEDVMRASITYFLITAASYPFIALYNAGAALLRVEGNSKLSLTVSLIANALNIGGNAILIFGFHMGVAGAALATLLSRIVSAAVILICLRAPMRRIVIRDYARIHPDMARIRKIMSLGIPSGIENGMFQFGKLAIQSSVSMMGTTAIAAQAMASVLEGLTGRAAEGIGLGLMTVIGQCIGGGLNDEARRSLKRLTLWGEIATSASCALMAASVYFITVLAGMETESARLCCKMTYLICIVKPLFWTTSFIPAYGMRAAGDGRFLMMVSSITMWSCRVVISTVLARVFCIGPWAVWFGMFSDWIVRSIIIVLRYRSGKWLKRAVIDAP